MYKKLYFADHALPNTGDRLKTKIIRATIKQLCVILIGTRCLQISVPPGRASQ